MICANHECRQEHKGPREAFDAHHEMVRVLQRAAEMRTDDGREYLRINMVRLGLELSGFCPSCVVCCQQTIAAVYSASSNYIDAEAEAAIAQKNHHQLDEVKNRAVHICKVIPLFPKRDLMIGSKP